MTTTAQPFPFSRETRADTVQCFLTGAAYECGPPTGGYLIGEGIFADPGIDVAGFWATDQIGDISDKDATIMVS